MRRRLPAKARNGILQVERGQHVRRRGRDHLRPLRDVRLAERDQGELTQVALPLEPDLVLGRPAGVQV